MSESLKEIKTFVFKNENYLMYSHTQGHFAFSVEYWKVIFAYLIEHYIKPIHDYCHDFNLFKIFSNEF